MQKVATKQARQLVEFSRNIKLRGRKVTLVVAAPSKRRRTCGLRLVARRHFRESEGASRWSRDVDFEQMREIAYSTSQPPRQVAIRFGLSPGWVRTIQAFVASAYLRFQNLLIGAILGAALQKKPDFCMTRMKWDETGERVTLQSQSGTATAQQSCATWQVFFNCI